MLSSRSDIYQSKQVQLINFIMNRVTDQLRENLMQRTSKPPPEVSNPPDLLMKHFENINQVNSSRPDTRLLPNHQSHYEQTLNAYSSKLSPIEAIISSNENNTHLVAECEKIVLPPLVPNLKSNSYEDIRQIRTIFQGHPQKENNRNMENLLLVVEEYADIMVQWGRYNRVAQNKREAESRSILQTPTYQELCQKSRKKVEPEESPNYSQFFSVERPKRKELLLMEILQMKKKSLDQNYISNMEIKLMELLDFILEEEEDYYGLEPEAKIKKVLKNLEFFQGKTLEGESKINLLRLFFEEFTELKRQKDQRERVQQTPMRKIDNRDRNTTNTKSKTVSSNTPQKTSKIPKRTNHIKWIDQPVRSHKKVAPNDQWIGSL